MPKLFLKCFSIFFSKNFFYEFFSTNLFLVKIFFIVFVWRNFLFEILLIAIFFVLQFWCTEKKIYNFFFSDEREYQIVKVFLFREKVKFSLIVLSDFFTCLFLYSFWIFNNSKSKSSKTYFFMKRKLPKQSTWKFFFLKNISKLFFFTNSILQKNLTKIF